MNYLQWKKEYAAHRAHEDKMFEALRAARQAWMGKELSRRWTFNSENHFIYIWEGELAGVSRHAKGSLVDLKNLSYKDIMAMARAKLWLDRYKAGEIEELPPDGPLP